MKISSYLRQRKAAADHKSPDDVVKRGEWNLKLYKSTPTRWNWYLENPQGGGGGLNTFPSLQKAIASALMKADRMDWKGKSKIWVIESEWSYDVVNKEGEEGDYVVKKTYWLDIPR